MKKEKIAEICNKAYDYLVSKGMNSTLVKIIVGAIFGIACSYLLTSCSMTYKHDGIEYKGSILTPLEVERDYK